MDWILFLAVIGVFGTIFFGIVTIYLTRKRKEPAWSYKTTNIIELGEKAPKELNLTYDGKNVQDVYKTTILIFNKGRDPIRKEDVTEPVTISFKGGEILNEPIIKAYSNKAIEFLAKRVKKDNEYSLNIDFYYLDHNDGAVIEILHTNADTIGCEANIIGARSLKYVGELEDTFPRMLSTKSIPPILLLLFTIFFSVSREMLNLPEYILELWLPFSMFTGAFLVVVLLDQVPKHIRSLRFPIWTRNVTKVAVPILQPSSVYQGDIMGYCAKCRNKKEMKETKLVLTAGGNKAIIGNCPDCGTKMFRMLPR